MGNFSKDPQTVLQDGLNRGYVAVHIEQGVPVLDRDLNLISDLNAALIRAALAHYIGNGAATGNNGFRIEGIGADNDFRIDAGQMLVNGIEVKIPSNMNYSSQTGVPTLTTVPAGPNRQDTVYLDFSLQEIDGSKDPNLLNSGDVGAQTSVRVQTVVVVLVAEGSQTPPAAPAGHTFVPLAQLTRPPGTKINAGNVSDLRQQNLTLAALEQRMRALEQIHAAAFGPAGSQFSVHTSAAGSSINILGRNFDIGPLRVIFTNTASSAQATATVAPNPLPGQAAVTVPTGVTGVCRLTVSNPFGADTSVDTFNVL